ncbi:hypothetical protein [Erythrobacter sp. CCH5-A1]|jgi:hypothetical protein|uniref:hypothetical protein n=1 Tax=Erythrobacter sp. CCH5-A1 TaxID=1768792 RepID=UPI0008378439|nr:hypothetical protein [Erythrobacter sp. CCH5-A1]
MRFGAILLALLLAACSGADERAPDAPPTETVAVAPAPTPVPAPSSAAVRVDCGGDDYGGYDNAKVCYYDQCDKGDAEACRMAESYNGNLFPDGDSKGLRLEDMTYSDARAVILSLGWSPLEGPCIGGGAGEAACSDFPEIGNCSGTGVGYCDMTFRREDRCLTVVTTGGAPDRTDPEGVAVEWVRFSKASCNKDPNGD